MIKKIGCMLLAASMILYGAGCAKKNQSAAVEEKKRPVRVIELKEESFPVELTYTGVVDAKETRKHSFKSSGRIAEVYVEKGQKITKGQKLVQLGTEDLVLAADAAKAQMDAAQAQYDKAVNGASQEELAKVELNVKKAEEVYNFAKETYDKTLSLFQQGSVSKDGLDKAKLEMEVRESDLNLAKEVESEAKSGAREEDKRALKNQLESARINYEAKKNVLDEATLVSDRDGYVVEILYREGEMVAAGYPVIAVRGQNQVVNFGVGQKEVSKINIGTEAKVEYEKEVFAGTISRIDQTPDKQTWTYNTEIELAERQLPLGIMVKVSVDAEMVKGLWIPVDIIMADGEDYVYVVEGDRAVRKNIKLGSLKGNKVEIQGLSVGEKLIVEGIKSLRDGDVVTIKPQDGGK